MATQTKAAKKAAPKKAVKKSPIPVQAPAFNVGIPITVDEHEAIQGLLRQLRRQKEEGGTDTMVKCPIPPMGAANGIKEPAKMSILASKLSMILDSQWQYRAELIKVLTVLAKLTGDVQDIKLDEPASVNGDNYLGTISNIQQYGHYLSAILQDVSMRLEDIAK